jgi:uncharacterized membrane protein YsdA (DUF1294 family)
MAAREVLHAKLMILLCCALAGGIGFYFGKWFGMGWMNHKTRSGR